MIPSRQLGHVAQRAATGGQGWRWPDATPCRRLTIKAVTGRPPARSGMSANQSSSVAGSSTLAKTGQPGG